MIKPPRQRILSATGRHEDQPTRCRSTQDILAGEKAFEAFRALKNTL